MKSFTAWFSNIVESNNYDYLDETHPLGHELDQQADKNPKGFIGFVHLLGTWAKEHPGNILKVIHKLRPVLTIVLLSLLLLQPVYVLSGLLDRNGYGYYQMPLGNNTKKKPD